MGETFIVLGETILVLGETICAKLVMGETRYNPWNYITIDFLSRNGPGIVKFFKSFATEGI